METLKAWLILLAILGFFGLIFYWQWSLWSECRQTNSFFYCVKVLGK